MSLSLPEQLVIGFKSEHGYETTEDALYAGIEKARASNRLFDISYTIQQKNSEISSVNVCL